DAEIQTRHGTTMVGTARRAVRRGALARRARIPRAIEGMQADRGRPGGASLPTIRAGRGDPDATWHGDGRDGSTSRPPKGVGASVADSSCDRGNEGRSRTPRRCVPTDDSDGVW